MTICPSGRGALTRRGIGQLAAPWNDAAVPNGPNHIPAANPDREAETLLFLTSRMDPTCWGLALFGNSWRVLESYFMEAFV